MRTMSLLFLEDYILLWIFIFSSKNKNRKNMINLQRVRRRPTGVIKELINRTYEQKSKKLKIPAILG